jgi:cadmium resistance protein CadD (predicted permease)
MLYSESAQKTESQYIGFLLIIQSLFLAEKIGDFLPKKFVKGGALKTTKRPMGEFLY